MIEYKRKLKKFENQSDYESQKNSVMGTPYVVLLEDTQEIIIEDKIDYSSQPFTLVALEDGTMDIAIPSGATFMNYSINDGAWIDNTEDIMLEVKANDKVKLKANAEAVEGYSYKIFDLSMPFNAEGNIMSLLYGNDFKDKTIIENNSCFFNCFMSTNIVSAKNLILPATTLAYECYRDMFSNCSSLVEAPQLPATTLASGCYRFMFGGCTSLVEAPQLPATTLAYECYRDMFSNCSSLVEAPQLPATTLTESCYFSMFKGTNVLPDCSNIDFSSESVVASGGLKGLFARTKVTDADLARILPKNSNGKYCLPVTTLANNCYYQMFEYCTSLIEAPELPATTLVNSCYSSMFDGCSKLNKITMLATDISATNCLFCWVNGVSSSGTFIKNDAMTSLPNGIDGIPNNWTVQNYNIYAFQPFTLVALEDGTMDIAMPYDTTSMHYSVNDGAWVETTEAISLPMKANDKVKLKAIGGYWNNGCFSCFSSTMPFNAEGNIMSLLYGDDFKDKTTIEYERCFENCFGYTNIVSAKNLILPATKLANDCYYNMFYNCSNLVEAPELPATTLADGCYSNMFNGCISLVEAPELLATTLASSCYYFMFNGCTSLVEAPELPATTLADTCYSCMFYDCTSLVEAPELLATTLATYCYSFMFKGCSNLNKITMLATDISASNCLYDWVNGVSSSGTFIKNDAMTSLPSGTSGIPNGWTIYTAFNGHEYVDLGLPSGTLWATKPITNADGEPLYFQWGDTEGWTAEQIQNGEKEFNKTDYKKNSKYFIDGKIYLDLEDDAAHVHMGGKWHIPTVRQIMELTANTSSSTITQNNVSGRLFTSKTNGNTIFIPSFGDANNGKIFTGGYYWSNTVNEYGAFSLQSNPYVTMSSHECSYGLCVWGVNK